MTTRIIAVDPGKTSGIVMATLPNDDYEGDISCIEATFEETIWFLGLYDGAHIAMEAYTPGGGTPQLELDAAHLNGVARGMVVNSPDTKLSFYTPSTVKWAYTNNDLKIIMGELCFKRIKSPHILDAVRVLLMYATTLESPGSVLDLLPKLELLSR